MPTNLFKLARFKFIPSPPVIFLFILSCISFQNKYIVSSASFRVFQIELGPVKNDPETFIEQLLNEKHTKEIIDIFK